MIGTGARPVVPAWAEVDHPHVSVVHTLPDAARLEELAAGCDQREVVVVGGGYIGVEMAEAFLARGAHVTMLTRSDHLLGNLDPEMSDRVAEQARRDGIDVLTGDRRWKSLTEHAVDHRERVTRWPRRHRRPGPGGAAQHRAGRGGRATASSRPWSSTTLVVARRRAVRAARPTVSTPPVTAARSTTG